jgi:hypothetical protein
VLLAKAAGMDVRRVSSFENPKLGEFNATWMLLTYNSNFFAQADVASRVREAAGDRRVRLWTDDYSSLLPLLRW